MKLSVSGIGVFFSLVFSGWACFAAGANEGGVRLGYSIQVGAFTEVKNAERMVFILREKGIEAFYIRKEGGGNAVRTGDFSTYDAARKTALKYAEEKKIDSFFITVPQTVSVNGKVRVGPQRDSGKPVSKKATEEKALIGLRIGEDAAGSTQKRGRGSATDGKNTGVMADQTYNLAGLNLNRTGFG